MNNNKIIKNKSNMFYFILSKKREMCTKEKEVNIS